MALLLLASVALPPVFDIKKVETKVSPMTVPSGATMDALQYFVGRFQISPWHDIPFTFSKDEHGTPLLSFVCEIPRGTREKFEIHKTAEYNAVIQDVHKNGTLREYVYSPAIINYGAIAQTWEDPNKPDDDTGLGGDNDPIDVLQLNEGACERGAIQRVRVLGALALIDDDETDWKLLVIDVDAADAPAWRDVTDIPKARVDEVREWYRMYKTAEGKGENKFGLDERAVDAKHALSVAEVTHAHWKALKEDPKVTCTFKKQNCWVKSQTKDEL